ncbi:MAG: asparagine synthase (glutamine-hydrolyzing) [Desulfobacteraceae bacterium]|nr:asparagine synthase (glutamine-hydrolyzing) [Desulfobacteraceae bacterium]
MCGITGKFNYGTGEPVSGQLIQAMCDKIVHRGPDDSGVFIDGPVGLGHRRLSIIDLSEQGHQPMGSRDGRYWITYNGEVYNFLSLRKELISLGYEFQSRCDTEVILYLYQEYGKSCLERLRGMFAFAIWDSKEQSLFLARDRIGKKPLFYYNDGRMFVFASEMKSILEDKSVKRAINYQAFYDYFKYLYVPDPKTIYRNMYKLRPGHYLTCSKDRIHEQEYWDVSFAHPNLKSRDEISEELYDILDQSVNYRMISDVPLGAFLSGGIDSSCVVAMMALRNNDPVTTCSIGFDSEEYDEVQFAKTVADIYKTDHHELTVKENVASVIKELPHYFDEPFADASAVPTYFVSKLARQRVAVALAGDGGDENFAGYEKYRLDDIENRFRNSIPECIRKSLFPSLALLLSGADSPVLQKGRTLLNTLGHDSGYGFYLTNTEMEDGLWNQLINDETRKNIGDYDPFSVTEHYYNKADTDNHLSKILYTDLKTYLPGDILVKVDRMSMAHSLEVRAPILDHNVIEYAASIPVALKYNKGEKKYILKRSLAKVLPEEILYRKKMGFSVPLAEWFRNEIKSEAEEVLFGDDSNLAVFFNIDTVKKIWKSHQTGLRNYGSVLWALYLYELWFRGCR